MSDDRNPVQKGIDYWKNHGAKGFFQRAITKTTGKSFDSMPYKKWLPRHLPKKKEQEGQRSHVFAYAPLISILVENRVVRPVYMRALQESLDSQTYSRWELCKGDHPDMHGDYVALVEADSVLSVHALYSCVEYLQGHKETKVLYGDHGQVSADGRSFDRPCFTPDYNPDLLCSTNYIGHFLVIRRDLYEKTAVQMKNSGVAGDYERILRLTEATRAIHRIPGMLYHKRIRNASETEDEEMLQVLREHYQRLGILARAEKGLCPGTYHTIYPITGEPLVSIIIPNKDHIADLQRCMDSIDQKSDYRNYEYIIIENNSTEKETFAFYSRIQEQNRRIRVVTWEGVFNYSAINNYGVSFAKGEYLLFLNNDTEMIRSDCLSELLGCCMRPETGCVGARLYYEDDTIQHAGTILGFGSIAGHAFVQQPRTNPGYENRIMCTQDYSAVTAACMMTKKSVFEQVGGFTEELAVAFNDVDYCMKTGKSGKLIVYNPYAELYHYESKSRGLEDTPEKVERFNREIDLFQKRWEKELEAGDPYYNPNLSLVVQDFSIKPI
ncbi:MAG: glycosyltransferase family 2 protein [Lachnospiraceae bacterium]|nr:glycosyltransferase family 2 protein [Lachnospiraceae bacterium]